MYLIKLQVFLVAHPLSKNGADAYKCVNCNSILLQILKDYVTLLITTKQSNDSDKNTVRSDDKTVCDMTFDKYTIFMSFKYSNPHKNSEPHV